MSAGDGVEVSVAALPALAGALNDAAAALDAAGADIPSVPDAGDSTALLAAGLGALTETVGALTAAIEASGAGVTDSAGTYRTVEATNAGGFDVTAELGGADGAGHPGLR